MPRMRLTIGVVAACAVTLAAAGCASPVAQQPRKSAQAAYAPASPRYYLSLGDSLARGVQPTATGASRPSGGGYPDRIYSVLRQRERGWHLVKLGCSGETSQTMIHGATCPYPAGNQLAQAEGFLRSHRGHVGLVTIDIGANDPNSCINGAFALGKIVTCMSTSVQMTLSDAGTIMAGLRAAAGPRVPILAMSYYVPELAGWLHGMTGKEIAVLTERLVAGYNQLLAGVYRHYGARTANVFGAFHSSDFTDRVRLPRYGLLPRNVATICTWTWSCARWPRGPNEHANDIGYGVIAGAFLRAYPQLSG